MGTTLVILIAILLISLFLGTPVSTALGMTALAAMLLFIDFDNVVRFGSIALTQGTSTNQMVAPLFILMAEFLSHGGVAQDIYDLLSRLLRKIRGGLAIATTLACTIFAALCGSSPATAASIGRISISQMIDRGYKPSFAVGTVAAGGTLGIMIPPSLTFVLYGIITETSIAKLLMAGLLPGVMLSLLFIISIVIRSNINPNLVGEMTKQQKAALEARKAAEDTSFGDARELASSVTAQVSNQSMKKLLLAAVPALVLIVIVLGAMYTGMATPTESAGVGAVGAMIIVFARRRITKKTFGETIRASVKTSAMILFMIIFGMTLSYVISYLGIAQQLATFIVGTGMNRWIVMIMLFILWFIMGCLMDPGSMVILTIPFIYPALVELGFDPIWIGVVSTLCVEIGMITPPVGLNLFVLRSVADQVPMTQILKGALPYVLVLIIGLTILCLFPQIALFLPSLM
ncbi:MAG: TRAP transporter large permease [Oscillospiraceae bacterium]|nr:TRAP transporter large permease [Oscillospiraceae bacterium]